MVRVLVLGLTDTVGGVETYLKELTLSSKKDDIVFDFLVKKGEKGCFEDDIIDYYGDSVCIHHVTRLKINAIESIRQMMHIAENYQYDVIYINTCTSSDILYAKLFFKGVPIVMHSHYSSSELMVSNLLFRKMARKCSSARLACSEKAASWMFGNKHKAIITHNGIDSGKYKYSDIKRKKIRDEYGLKDNDLLIGNVGRLTEQKNQSFLIEMAKLISDYNEEELLYHRIMFAIIGNGPDEQKLRRLSQKLGIESNIVMPGVVENTDEFYCAFDVFVMPSLYEGLPIVGIEAQCSGLPCFFSDEIDRQVLITDRSRMVHLSSENDNYQEWASVVWNCCKRIVDYRNGRNVYANCIIEKGYDIKTVADEVCKILKESSE